MLDLDYIFDPDRTACSSDRRLEELPLDWRLEFEERAAILEYDGGLPREHAEAEALREIGMRMRTASMTAPAVAVRTDTEDL